MRPDWDEYLSLLCSDAPAKERAMYAQEIEDMLVALTGALKVAREYMRHSLGSRYEGPDPYPIIDAALSKAAPDFPPQEKQQSESA